MTDGNDPWAMPFERSYHPEDPLDRAIMDTREAVFPALGPGGRPVRVVLSSQPSRAPAPTRRVRGERGA